MNRSLTSFCLTAFLLALSHCRINNGYTSKPARSAVSPDSDLPEINMVAWHLNDSITAIYVEIKNENLLYKRPDTSLAFYTDLKVSYKVLPENETRKVLDTGSVEIYDRSESERVSVKPILLETKLHIKRGQDYNLELNLLDRNRKTRYSSNIDVFKQNLYGAQNFLVKQHDSIAFNNYFAPGDEVSVLFAGNTAPQVTVECYGKDFGPALPPFSLKQPDESRFKPDSVFYLSPVRNSFNLTLPVKGFYHVKTSSASAGGLTLYSYDNSFPEIGSSMDMIYATRYIMEKTEYENCRDAAAAKAAIDKFWFNIGGSNERARELIKRYYSRVNEANRYYTSYVPGWKSDRGMIYIVFGTPTNIYKSRRDEIWVYGNEANPAALRFVFNKTANSFSENDFVLERSAFFKEAWYGAVEYWRQGTIYFESRR